VLLHLLYCLLKIVLIVVLPVVRQLGLNILINGCYSPAVEVAPPAGAAAIGCTRRKIRLIEGNVVI
jgi:hypothetical protein